ncbi:hypothetical protein BD410DRAFT_352852 [Rickenella mellea]|uniref:Uncharacterized protein n=1 Tax=Rickenella mellea TaxID=50990 RepID=A0A4Y7QMV9_9AGAM|nr:hypothetical protein BD410DRAFT_352852 [Rickenella mellea]
MMVLTNERPCSQSCYESYPYKAIRCRKFTGKSEKSRCGLLRFVCGRLGCTAHYRFSPCRVGSEHFLQAARYYAMAMPLPHSAGSGLAGDPSWNRIFGNWVRVPPSGTAAECCNLDHGRMGLSDPCYRNDGVLFGEYSCAIRWRRCEGLSKFALILQSG